MKAVELINEKFGDKKLLDGTPVLAEKIEVRYYDGLPSTDEEDNIIEENESEVVYDDTEL